MKHTCTSCGIWFLNPFDSNLLGHDLGPTMSMNASSPTAIRMRATICQSFQYRPPININTKYSLIVDLRFLLPFRFMDSAPTIAGMPLLHLLLPQSG